MEEQKEFEGQCTGTTYERRRCRRKAAPGSDRCRQHGRRSQPVETDRAPAASPKPEGSESRPAKRAGSLSKKIEQFAKDPELFDLKTSVAALKTLIKEHLARLDKIRDAKDGDEEADLKKMYNGALEAHGKRIQSIAGELFAAIDKITRIEERRRMVMPVEEVLKLVTDLKERVIRAARSMKAGDPPEELARKLADAFNAVDLAGGEE